MVLVTLLALFPMSSHLTVWARYFFLPSKTHTITYIGHFVTVLRKRLWLDLFITLLMCILSKDTTTPGSKTP